MAKKGRKISSVITGDKTETGNAVIYFTGSSYGYGPNSLSHVELTTACSMAFPNSGQWLRVPGEKKRYVLNTGSIPTDVSLMLKGKNNMSPIATTDRITGSRKEPHLPCSEAQEAKIKKLIADGSLSIVWPTRGMTFGEADAILAEWFSKHPKVGPSPRYTPPRTYTPPIHYTPPIETPVVESPVPAPSPVPVPANSIDALVESIVSQAVASAVEEVTAKVDIDSIRADVESMVDGAIAKYVARPVQVHFKDRPEPITITESAHTVLPRLVKMVQRGLNVMLVGPAGSGKSHLAKQCAQALGMTFYSDSFDPTKDSSQVFFGYTSPIDHTYYGPAFYHAYTSETPALYLGDEFDNGHPSINTGANQALSNGECAFANGNHKRGPSVGIICTANTYGTGPDPMYVGRNQLDAATLDRFVFLTVGYDNGLEDSLSLAEIDDQELGRKWIAHVRTMRARANELRLPVLVSMRDSIIGCSLLDIGESWDEVMSARFGNVSPDTLAKLTDR